MDIQFTSSLEETLRQTFSPQLVKQATAKLTKDFYGNPMALPSLFHILQTSQDENLKQLAAVEARKLILSSWEGMDSALKPQIRESVINIAFTLPSKNVRHSTSRAVAAIAEVDLGDNQWPDLLPILVKSVQDADQQVKEMAVFTLYSILDTKIPALNQHVGDFLALFSELMTDRSSMDIRVNAVKSLEIISEIIEEELEVKPEYAPKFKDNIPGMVQVFQELIANDDSDNVKDLFIIFQSLVYLDAKLVGDNLVALIKLMLEIASNQQLDEDYRSSALDFLVSCVSIRKSRIASNKLGPEITLIAMKISSEEIDIDDELNTESEENENEENLPPTLALRLVAMLSAELPPSQVLTPLFENVGSMLSSSNHFERRAGLLCIGVASSGAPDFYTTQVNKVILALVSGLKDSEMVVRVAALRALSQLTSELQDVIAEYHEELLPLIIQIIDSTTSVKAYKYACYALDGLIEFMSYDAIAKYIEPLIEKLFRMLQQANSSSLKAAIVSAIGSTAYAGGKGFIPYFNNSVQYLEPFISNSAETEGMSEDDIELRAITFENISTMARAVGSEAFSAYADPLVQAAYAALSSEHSRIRESGFAFISNMAKVYGSKFSGFLDQIVPEILKCLQQEEFTFNLDEEEEDFGDDEEEGLESKFNVNTGITIEKEIASVALSELAIGTGASFAKYVEPAVKVLEEQVEYSYGMREAAMNALWKISTAMFKAEYGDNFKPPKGVPQLPYVNDSILQLIRKVREISIQNLEEGFELTMVACILDNLSDNINGMGSIVVLDSASDTALLEKLCVQLMLILKKEHTCQMQDEEEFAGDDDSETDVLLFESALEVLCSLSEQLGADFNRIFSSFKDIILSQVGSESKSKRVCVVGSLAAIALGLKESNQSSEDFLRVFTESLANESSLEVKGNAAYGLGILVEYCPNDLSSAYSTFLELLFNLLSQTQSKSDIDEEETQETIKRASANACGCVARMALKNQEAVPLPQVIPALLSCLPLETAYEENAPILNLILRLYESNNDLILNETNKIVEIFAKIFEKEFERIKLAEESTLGREENMDKMKQFQTDELKQRVIELIKYLDQKYNGIVSQNPVLKSLVAQ